MSLRPASPFRIPKQTARVAFPQPTFAMRLADTLGPIFKDEQFAALFPAVGKPALSPARLALVTLLQYAENLPDRAAADSVRARIDWKYLLGLDLEDPGFDFTDLHGFRARLMAGGAEALLLETLLRQTGARPTTSVVLVVGATGLVGQHVLERALANERINRVVAPTRRPLPEHAKLLNPLVDFSELPDAAAWWAVDGAVCTLGTTRAKAGSDWDIRTVDHDYPLKVARLVRGRGATRFALCSTMGAGARSHFLYTRTKGELEEDLRSVGFRSLTLVRPGLIGGERDEFRAAERIAAAILGTLGPLLPRRYCISPAAVIADVLIDAAVEGAPGSHVIEAEERART
jgi:uncharacterized protein YbjT (DUF2867 family)/transposase